MHRVSWPASEVPCGVVATALNWVSHSALGLSNFQYLPIEWRGNLEVLVRHLFRLSSSCSTTLESFIVIRPSYLGDGHCFEFYASCLKVKLSCA